MSHKSLYTISFTLAVIPMIVGVLIFLIWWAARVFFAEDLYNVEAAGFYWMMVSVILLATSLITITIYVFKKQNSEKWKRFFIILVLTGLNFLILKMIIRKVEDVQQFAYVKIANETGQDLNINFHTYLKSGKPIQLKQERSKIISYIPQYIMKSERDYDIEPLIFEANGKVVEIKGIDRNDCKKFILEQNFQIIENH